jgi:hypothetical protein
MTNTTRAQRFRERRRDGKLLLPRIEIDGTTADDLVEHGLLQEWDTENPEAVADAVVRLLKLLPDIHLVIVRGNGVS